MVGKQDMDQTLSKERATGTTGITGTTSATGATGDIVRDHLSNKRTMLAWARTGMAVMALGFVVARFGLLLRELRPLLPRRLPEGVSTAFGTTLVVIGGILVVLAALDYVHTGRAIDRNAYKWSPALEIALSLLLVLAAVVLAVYLVLTG